MMSLRSTPPFDLASGGRGHGVVNKRFSADIMTIAGALVGGLMQRPVTVPAPPPFISYTYARLHLSSHCCRLLIRHPSTAQQPSF